jgi:hypothetical protein
MLHIYSMPNSFVIALDHGTAIARTATSRNQQVSRGRYTMQPESRVATGCPDLLALAGRGNQIS